MESTKRDYGPIMVQFVLPGKPSGETPLLFLTCLLAACQRTQQQPFPWAAQTEAEQTRSVRGPLVLSPRLRPPFSCLQPPAWTCGT